MFELKYYTPPYPYDNLVARGNWERGILDYVVEYDRKRTCFVDVGANGGAWTLPAAFVFRQVVAIECARENVDVLYHNLDLNDLRNVTVIPIAAWDKLGELYLNQMYEGDFASEIHCSETPDTKEWEARQRNYNLPYANPHLVKQHMVQCAPIDALNLSPSLVKIDIEGAELHALRGMVSTIKRCRPLMVCEMHSIENDVACSELMAGLGYRKHDINHMNKLFIPE